MFSISAFRHLEENFSINDCQQKFWTLDIMRLEEIENQDEKFENKLHFGNSRYIVLFCENLIIEIMGNNLENFI